MVVLEDEVYNSLVQDIRCFEGLSRDCKEFLRQKYPKVPSLTIGSILSAQWQLRMKQTYRKSPHHNKNYYKMYESCRQNGDAPGILLRLSVENNMAPALMAGSVLQHIHDNTDASQHSVKQELKDATRIQDKDLAYEIYLCNLYDNEYGSFGNIIKHSIGREYEHRVEHELRQLNITYIDENVLRSKGYDKTPDFKLIIPIAVDGFVINWIESKALFGDDATHAGYLKDQLLCYWNRFGPGLVIYWFGYLKKLEATPENNTTIIFRDSFPELKSITLMNPSLVDE